MSKLFFKLTALFAFLHWLLLYLGTMVALGAGMHRLDHPDFPISLSECISRLIAPVLMQPGLTISEWLRGYSASRVLHGGVDLWNSLLWGAIIALIVYKLTDRAAAANSQAKNLTT